RPPPSCPTRRSSDLEYLDLSDPQWGLQLRSTGRELGFQSFALHPQFAEPGAPGYGKLYTYADTRDMAPAADFGTEDDRPTHHTVDRKSTRLNSSHVK